MKAAPFDYVRPSSVEEACAILASDDGARLIAGGQTLAPMMAMRLARPTRLVDIARIDELAFVEDAPDRLTIGSTTKQAAIERSAVVATQLPLLAKAIPHVGHAATRARGTIGGSIANADPAAELALIVVTLGATLAYRRSGATGEIAAADFFTGPMTTALPEAACLTAIQFSKWSGARIGVAFHEISGRRSDFAFAAAAAQIAVDEEGRCRRAAVGVGAVAAKPERLTAVEDELRGQFIDERMARDLVELSFSKIDAMADLHASPAYRRRVGVAMAVRAICDAAAAATDSTNAN